MKNKSNETVIILSDQLQFSSKIKTTTAFHGYREIYNIIAMERFIAIFMVKYIYVHAMI